LHDVITSLTPSSSHPPECHTFGTDDLLSYNASVSSSAAPLKTQSLIVFHFYYPNTTFSQPA